MRTDASPAAASAPSATVAAVPAGCVADSLRPVAAAPAAGLWAGEDGTPLTRVAAMVGPAITDAERGRIMRRVETLELRPGADSLRVAIDTASVTLELLPPVRARGAYGARARSADADAAAIYAITPLVLLASYEACAAAAGEPRIRYLRRKARGGVATDVMLRRESAGTAGAIP